MEVPYRDGRPSALPESLWLAVTPEIDLPPVLAGYRRVDVGIVGAGFMGLAAALKLAENGARVAVIEASQIGWGASGRNNGQIIPGLKRDPHKVRRILGDERAAYSNSLEELKGAVIPLRTAQVASAPLQQDEVDSVLPGGEVASDTQRLLTSFRITPDRRLIMGSASATAGDHNSSLVPGVALAVIAQRILDQIERRI